MYFKIFSPLDLLVLSSEPEADSDILLPVERGTPGAAVGDIPVVVGGSKLAAVAVEVGNPLVAAAVDMQVAAAAVVAFECCRLQGGGSTELVLVVRTNHF